MSNNLPRLGWLREKEKDLEGNDLNIQIDGDVESGFHTYQGNHIQIVTQTAFLHSVVEVDPDFAESGDLSAVFQLH